MFRNLITHLATTGTRPGTNQEARMPQRDSVGWVADRLSHDHLVWGSQIESPILPSNQVSVFSLRLLHKAPESCYHCGHASRGLSVILHHSNPYCGSLSSRAQRHAQ